MNEKVYLSIPMRAEGRPLHKTRTATHRLAPIFHAGSQRLAVKYALEEILAIAVSQGVVNVPLKQTKKANSSKPTAPTNRSQVALRGLTFSLIVVCYVPLGPEEGE
jgi:hypothetical protein